MDEQELINFEKNYMKKTAIQMQELEDLLKSIGYDSIALSEIIQYIFVQIDRF